MKEDKVIINGKEFVVKKELETIDNSSVGFLVYDDDWIYGIKQNGKWNEWKRGKPFPKLNILREVKDAFLDEQSVDTLEKVYDKLMGLDKYTIILNLAELKWSGCNKDSSLMIKPSNWVKLLKKDKVWETVLGKNKYKDVI